MKLVSAEVFGMLGRYDHRVTFAGDPSRFRIIYGPNGVGKTKFLELISAMLSLDPHTVSVIPYGEAELVFDDGTVYRSVRTASDESERVGLIFTLMRPGMREPLTWHQSELDQRGRTEFLRTMERDGLWQEIRPGVWQDPSDGETLDEKELRERYSRHSRGADTEPPPEFREAFAPWRIHLIETQRLHNYHTKSHRSARERGQNLRSTVLNFTTALKGELQRVQALNSRASQQLERTFPRRVLDVKAQVPKDVTEIRRKYDEQSEFRTRLASIGLIANEIDIPLPSRSLEDWETSVLWIYLTDTDEKLRTFANLLQKVEAFTAVINKRFLDKQIRVSADEGLIIEDGETGRRLPADALSSGEQHELILMYDLTFNVVSGAVVMIDEPEISLHVSWQLEFLRDVAAIAELSDFQFLVATHSPQIIADNWSRAVAFGPVSEGFH
jgi:ABC-type lipoprotein export system ATPase subunit